MARRRKNRTHLKGIQSSTPTQDSLPKSFVIKHGQVGTSLTQLTRDVRKVMEPNTATRLKERSRNKLRDFLTMAPALHVTHLIAFTLTDIAPSMRIVRLSNGPTLSFRVERYSLVKDIIASSRHAKYLSSIEAMSAPLVRPPAHKCFIHKITRQPLFCFLSWYAIFFLQSSSSRRSPHRVLQPRPT